MHDVPAHNFAAYAVRTMAVTAFYDPAVGRPLCMMVVQVCKHAAYTQGLICELQT